MNNEFDLPVSWHPTPEKFAESNVAAQMAKHGISDYAAFLRRSFEDPDWFWRAFFEDTGFRWLRPYHTTLDLSSGKPWAKWFVGGELNWTYNALDQHIERGRGDARALVWEGEEGDVRTFTFHELREGVERMAATLRRCGIGRGDAVGLFLPFIPEVAIALLAVARIGAVAIPLFSGFGPEPLEMRLNDASAKVLICADGVPRRGRVSPMKLTADDALENCPTIERVLVVQRTGIDVPMKAGRDEWYEPTIGDVAMPEAFASDQPYMIIYTSGTTGRPKGAVHVHSGFPVKSAQDMFHLFDVKPGDVVSWMTDIGWMMGPWLISGALILGATVFMYDGSPDTPAADRIWKMVERHSITHLGITPTLIRALMRMGDRHPEGHEMSSLMALGSTGEPWNPEPWVWAIEKVGKGRTPIINYSGGTEISGGILGCVPFLPLKPASFNSLVPGVDATVVSESGEELVGEVGRLIVRNVNPGMTRGFWKDPQRYEETYWTRFPDAWDHGDLVLRDTDGYYFILGRSDDTLKIAGKRVGPAEIESALVEHPAVSEAAVIGVPDELKGQSAVGFVILRPAFQGTRELEVELLQLVAKRMGKPLMPKTVRFVTDLPKTRNAKIMRRVIKAAYLGEDPGDLTALENPQTVEEIRQRGSEL